MKILLFGANGQVGWQLRRSLSVLGEVIALDRNGVVGGEKAVISGERAVIAGEKAVIADERAVIAGSTRNPAPVPGAAWMPGQARHDAGAEGQARHDSSSVIAGGKAVIAGGQAVTGGKAVIAGSTRNPAPVPGAAWMPGQARHDTGDAGQARHDTGAEGQARHDTGDAGRARHDSLLSGDLSNPEAIAATVAALRPDIVVNAAAYTAVDRAEDDRDAAFTINAQAPEALARATRALGIWLVHFSTDYVYDGKGDRPWRESDPTGPLSVYGHSKLAGDQAIAAHNPRHLILRTSWVFDSWGQNFAKSILKSAATRDELTVVTDQWGAPTRAALIADVTAHAVRTIISTREPDALAGVYHLATRGFTTWHAYAQLLVQEAQARGLPLRVTPDRVKPIPASAYPVKAPRPANSRLDTTRLRETFGLNLPDWQDGVRAVVAELSQLRAVVN